MAKRLKSGGRQKGSLNRKTVDQLNRAESILRLLESKYFESDITKISARERVILYTAMLEYVAPKLSRREIRGTVDNKMIIEVVRKYPITPEFTSPQPAESN